MDINGHYGNFRLENFKISERDEGGFSKKNHEISENFVFIGIFHKNA